MQLHVSLCGTTVVGSSLENSALSGKLELKLRSGFASFGGSGDDMQRLSRVSYASGVADYRVSCTSRAVQLGSRRSQSFDLGHIQVGSYRYRSLIKGLYTLQKPYRSPIYPKLPTCSFL